MFARLNEIYFTTKEAEEEFKREVENNNITPTMSVKYQFTQSDVKLMTNEPTIAQQVAS